MMSGNETGGLGNETTSMHVESSKVKVPAKFEIYRASLTSDAKHWSEC